MELTPTQIEAEAEKLFNSDSEKYAASPEVAAFTAALGIPVTDVVAQHWADMPEFVTETYREAVRRGERA